MTQNKKILQVVIIFLLKRWNDQMKSTSNSGSKLWDWASFFKSINHWVILGLGTAAHPGFPPCGGTSPSFKCGTPNSKYFHKNKPQLNCKWIANRPLVSRSVWHWIWNWLSDYSFCYSWSSDSNYSISHYYFPHPIRNETH